MSSFTRYEKEAIHDAQTQGREDASNAHDIGEPVPSLAELMADPDIRRSIQDNQIEPLSAAALEAAVRAWAEGWRSRASYMNERFA